MPRAGGPLAIVPTYVDTPNFVFTTAQKLVIQQAIDEWQAMVQDSGSTPNPYSITFNLMAIPGACNGGSNAGGPCQVASACPGGTCVASNKIAVTSTTYNGANGDLISANMNINTNKTFFVDPTPGDDTEFASGSSPPSGIDLLTIMRHEIGHALGWTNSAHFVALASENVFDAPRLNVAIDPASGSHVDAAWLPNDVMTPSITGGIRRAISVYPQVSVVARAYGYRIPLHFVDPSSGGTQTGTANEPWRTLQDAAASSPPSMPLLLANVTHHVDASFSIDTNHIINAARGGAIIVAP